MLHITNGDCARNLMLQAGISEPILAWADILHEGPLPNCATLADFGRVRSEFLAEFSGRPKSEIERSIEQRDQIFLQHLQQNLPIQLWFEPDLYDQLQLSQIAFEIERSGSTSKISLIQLQDQYLGMLTIEQMRALVGTEKQVEKSQIEAASVLFKACTADSPEVLDDLAGQADFSLPFMQAAAQRLIQERPDRYGLSRTQKSLLFALTQGLERAPELFEAMAQQETYRFLGDLSWLRMTQQMRKTQHPLIELYPDSAQLDVPLKASMRLRLSQSGVELSQRIELKALKI